MKRLIVNKLEAFFYHFMKKYAFSEKSIRLNRFKDEYKTQIQIDPTFSSGEFFTMRVNSKFANLLINKDVAFRDYCSLTLDLKGKLTIQENVFFNNYCSLTCLGEIEIGSGSLFGEGVRIYDHNHGFSYSESGLLNVKQDEFKIGKVTIGNNCWIGSNVVILNNVEIGENSIIGAGCLIYKSIPPNSVVKHKEELIITTSKS